MSITTRVGIVQQALAGGIEIVGSTTSTSGNSMSVPSGMNEGDVLFYFAGADGGDPPVPTGFTQIVRQSSAVDCISAYKVQGPTPDTSIDGIQDSPYDYGPSRIAVAVRGLDTLNVLDVSYQTAGGSSGMPDCPSITPVTAGCCIMAIGLLDDDRVASAVSAPSGFELIDAVDSGNNGMSTSMVAFLIQAAAAVINPGIFGGGGNDYWQSLSLALRPA